MTEAMWIFPANSKIDVILPDGTHRYWSTHCRHGNHDACASNSVEGEAIGTLRGEPGQWLGELARIERKPAQCKTCAAPCICPCHKNAAEEASDHAQ